MPGARHEAKQLGGGVEKVDDLRYEEEHHGLAEVAQDADHCKRHPGKVAVSVTNKHSRRIPGRGTEERKFQQVTS